MEHNNSDAIIEEIINELNNELNEFDNSNNSDNSDNENLTNSDIMNESNEENVFELYYNRDVTVSDIIIIAMCMLIPIICFSVENLFLSKQ